MIGRHRRLVGAAVVVALAGCGGDDTPDTPTATVTQSGDTTIIVPVLDGPTGRLVSDLVLGADDSNPDAIFGRISDATLAPDSRIYVLEGQTQSVYVYSPSGVALGRLTRRGEGPGEIRSAGDLVVRDDGYVLIREVGGDIEVFGPDGAYLDTWDLGWGSGPDVQMGTSGDVLIYQGRDIPTDGAPWGLSGEEIYSAGTAPSPDGDPTGRIYRMSSEGVLVDTTMSVVLDTEIPCLVNPPALAYCWGMKFHPGPWMKIGPDGALWSGRTNAYRLDRSPGLGPADLPLLSIRPHREPLPITGGLRDAVDGPIREIFTEWDDFNELYPIPTHKPALARVFLTRGGSIWVRLHAPSERSVNEEGEERWVETESRFDIFTPEGEHVGYVTGPVELRLQDIRGDTVLASRIGSYGVPYIERFVIEWSDPQSSDRPGAT